MFEARRYPNTQEAGIIYAQMTDTLPRFMFSGTNPDAIPFLRSPTNSSARNRVSYMAVRAGTNKARQNIPRSIVLDSGVDYYLALGYEFPIDPTPESLAVMGFYRPSLDVLSILQFQGALLNLETPYDGRSAFHDLNFVHWAGLMVRALHEYATIHLPDVKVIEISTVADERKDTKMNPRAKGSAKFAAEVIKNFGFKRKSGSKIATKHIRESFMPQYPWSVR